MHKFSPAGYGPTCASLLAGDRQCELGPGIAVDEKREALAALNEGTVFGDRPLADPQMARAAIAGLWLLHGYLDQSHTISQELHTATGSYWHGIMHRREPDFPNAKYWFRRVGRHPIFERLNHVAMELAEHADLDATAGFLRKPSDWDPFAFVDLCENSYRGHSSNNALCRQVAQAEWELLFDYCYTCATGS